MTRTEKLVTAAVLVVSLSVGIVSIQRADDPELAGSAPLAPDTVAALSPMLDAPRVTISGEAGLAKSALVARR